MPRIGVRKLYFMLQDFMDIKGIKMGRDGLFKLLGDHQMLVKQKRKYVKTTQSKHHFYKYGNRIKGMEITRPESVWVSDITYIRTQNGFCYLSLITDAYSRKIMGYWFSDNLRVENCLNALKMAIKNRKYPNEPLIHHSDRGFQYCNPRYTQLAEENGIELSMTQSYDPYENAIAERVNGILKQEFGLDHTFGGIKMAERTIQNAIRVYNHRRPHWKLQFKTPGSVHQEKKRKGIKP
jgi:putative transposase